MLPLDVAISAGSQPAGNIGCLLSLGTAFHMLGTLDDLDDFCCGIAVGSMSSTEVSILAVQRAHVALPIFVASTFRPFELPNKNLRGFSRRSKFLIGPCLFFLKWWFSKKISCVVEFE